MNKNIFKIYGALILGIPLFILVGLQIAPSAGWLTYWIPILAYIIFSVFVSMGEYKRKWLHFLCGLFATGICWLISILTIGAMSMARTGLSGIQ